MEGSYFEKFFDRKRLSISEGSNNGKATCFLHTNAQDAFYKRTQRRIFEFGSSEAALKAAIAEHEKAGIKWQGSIKTKCKITLIEKEPAYKSARNG